jgi:peptide/nickel transport system substrate-binding protein
MTTTRRHLARLAAGAPALAVLARAPFAAAQASRTLNVGIVSDPVTLDPAMMASFFEILVQYNIHEPLLHSRPTSRSSPGSPPSRSWIPVTYVLHDEARPQLPRRHADRRGGGEGEFRPHARPGDGLAAARRARADRRHRGVNATTFTVRFKAPFAPFVQVLTNRAGMMVSPTALRSLGADFATRAVGAGPFRVTSWTKNAELVLERFPGYWRNGLPTFDRVVFRPIADETVRLANLRSGTLQLIDGVPPQSVAQLGREPNIAVKQQPGLGFNAFSFNTTRAPFNDVRVRRAFVASMDPDVIQRVVYFNTGAPAYGPIPPSIGWAHDKNFKPSKFDRDGAKKLLAEAGHSAPVPVTITVTNSPLQVRIAEILQSQANQAGFKVEIKQIDASSLITVLRQKDFDLCMSPWSGRSDPDGNMFNYFTKTGPEQLRRLAVGHGHRPADQGAQRRRPRRARQALPRRRGSDRGRNADAVRPFRRHHPGGIREARMDPVRRRRPAPAIRVDGLRRRRRSWPQA